MRDDSHETGPTYDGSYVAFSLDHTQFALCNGTVVTVQNSTSRAIVAEFHTANGDDAQNCCFSPDGRFVAAVAGTIIYTWDITGSNPYLVEIFVGHTDMINSLIFSSSCLISASDDNSVKFWKIGVLSTDPVAAGPKSNLPASALIQSVSLQARDRIVISSDSAGVVKTWDILTGICKTSFQTPATDWTQRDAQLIDGRVILVWYTNNKVHIWDTEKGELLQTLDAPWPSGLRISGDGSKVFCLSSRIIQAWNMWTWELVGEVELEDDNLYLDSFCPSDSNIWVRSGGSLTQGWDFRTPDSPPVLLCKTYTERPHLDFIGGPLWQTDSPS